MAALASADSGDIVQVPRAAFEHEGFRRWALSDEFPPGLRATFVEGEILLEMSPEELETHNKVKLAISVEVMRFVQARDLGEVYPDGMLISSSASGLSCEPDLSFVSWRSFERGRVRLVRKAHRKDRYVEVEGGPDLVVEIVSDSSVRKDRDILRSAYQRAGVTEYWLVDARPDPLRFEILLNDGRDFVPSAGLNEPQRSSVLGSAWVLSRAPNRVGRFSYELRAV
jgi:Uma2 family endonuclease